VARPHPTRTSGWAPNRAPVGGRGPSRWQTCWAGGAVPSTPPCRRSRSRRGIGAALAVGAVVAGVRLRRGDRPRSVLIGLLAVCVAALIAVRTGRAEDFFLIQVLSNAASALAWAVSIVVRWPLLGVLVGGVLGQRTRWRRDRALLRGYGRASWVWTATYLLRLAVFVPLYLGGQVLALVVARVALTWPLVAAALALSWVVLRRSLPAGHPGLRHPVGGEPSTPPD
jgi:hypothetical protein